MGGEYVRQSLNLTVWGAAQERIRGWEASGQVGVVRQDVATIREAVEKHLEDAEGRNLKPVFELADIAGGTVHRFRDTFAVELLLKGVPIEQVSVLLGHPSLKITEKHYAPWVKARQDQLEQSVRLAWSA